MQSQPERNLAHDAPEAARIVVCADDFGIESGVDAGIVELASAGRLSAISCLTGGPGFAARAPDLAGLDSDLGVHLNFTEALGGAGTYRSHPVLVALAFARRLNRSAAYDQIMNQFDLFEQHVGRAPDFVDGHLHVHQLPVIRDQLVEIVTRRYAQSPPWLRDTMPGELDQSLPFMQRFKPQVIASLGGPAMAALARLSGLRCNLGFFGSYDFDRPHPPYPVLLEAWLRHATDGSLLMTHPARSFAAGVAFGHDRLVEFETLGSDVFIELLERYRLQICRGSAIL